MPHILVVEDDRSLREALAYNLQREGYDVSEAADGMYAVQLARQKQPELILLDLMLPGESGLDVCRAVRRFSNAPIIMVTARAEDADRVLGLELGADDYVTKPFSMHELLARIRANLRRIELDRDLPGDAVLTNGELMVDKAAHRVTLEDREIELQPREFDLLVYFMRHPGIVLSRGRLLVDVWGHTFVGERTVDVHVRRLRAKLGYDQQSGPISTIHRVGYAFRPPAGTRSG